jgi:hypothetical protein
VSASNNLDALLPPEIAKRAEEVGAQKCRLPFWPLLTLAVLAGAFIALGAIFSTTVSAESTQVFSDRLLVLRPADEVLALVHASQVSQLAALLGRAE